MHKFLVFLWYRLSLTDPSCCLDSEHGLSSMACLWVFFCSSVSGIHALHHDPLQSLHLELQEPEYYDYMKSYSPVDNIGTISTDYPNILVTAGLHDPRVCAHSSLTTVTCRSCSRTCPLLARETCHRSFPS